MNKTLKLALAGISVALAAVTLIPVQAAYADSGQVVARNYSWSSDTLTLDVPGDVHFHSAPTWSLTIRAPERVLDQLVVRNGEIKAKSHGCFSIVPLCIGYSTDIDGHVQVDISGPQLRGVTLNGSGKVALEGVHQNRLTVTIHGSGRIVGDGSVQNLSIEIDGSGRIRLAQLTETNANVSIAGSGDVDITPSGNVSVNIAGSGKVRMHSHPKHIVQRVFGSGEVIEVPGSRPTGSML